MAVKRIVPDLPLKDVEASAAFYSNVLGLELGMDLGWVMNFGSPDDHPVQVNLIRRDATAPVDPQATVEVTDVEGVYAACLDRDLPIVYPLTDEPWGVRRFFVRDPNGVVLNIMAHLPRGG
jgi:catechol 2,3-dioxygenase-like lactoylglutathione lyase family enzyme